jgi:hypothetical protein
LTLFKRKSDDDNPLATVINLCLHFRVNSLCSQYIFLYFYSIATVHKTLLITTYTIITNTKHANHSPFISYHSPYIIYVTPFPTHHLRHTIPHTSLMPHYSPHTTYVTSFPIHHLRYTIFHTPLTLHYSPHTIPHTPFTLHHSPHTIYVTSFPAHHLRYIIPRTSFAPQYSPHTINTTLFPTHHLRYTKCSVYHYLSFRLFSFGHCVVLQLPITLCGIF